MGHLNPKKLHVTYLSGVGPKAPIAWRHYTLTHSDITNDLYLTIGCDYNLKQISGWYTRFMRDEILAEWKGSQDAPSLHVYCHVSGGLVFARAPKSTSETDPHLAKLRLHGEHLQALISKNI